MVRCREWHESCFTAYGKRYGLRAGNPGLLGQMVARVPFGWYARVGLPSDVSRWFTLHQNDGNPAATYRLTIGDDHLIESVSLPVVLDEFARHADLMGAERARDSLFVHAGVVAWRDRAIVIPGASGSGKTTLVRAFLAAGATYLSDEYARLDIEGRVHPHARPLCIRGADRHRVSVTAAELGARAAPTPLPVSVILLTSYDPDACWQPRGVSAGRALVGLMQHTIAARRHPEYSMPILKATAERAIALEGPRPDACVVVRAMTTSAMFSVGG